MKENTKRESIQLTAKQLEIISGLEKTRAELVSRTNEINKQMEDTVLVIAEAHGKVLTEKAAIEGDLLHL